MKSNADLYTAKYLYDALFLLECNLDELSKWSVHNNDELSAQINSVEKSISELKKYIYDNLSFTHSFHDKPLLGCHECFPDGEND